MVEQNLWLICSLVMADMNFSVIISGLFSKMKAHGVECHLPCTYICTQFRPSVELFIL
uniref:Uncharacterized protein n=1 Tax=Triticum urartu TaxID=4572 RepID=A0A8R7UDI2_TRIUA